MTNMLLMGCDSPSTTYTQRTLDDLGTPLSEVTFCVVDLETTGLSPNDCKITEIGAALFKGGEPKATKVGATTKSNIVSWIQENI